MHISFAFKQTHFFAMFRHKHTFCTEMVDASLRIICNVRMVNVVACIIDRVLDASECGVNVDCFVSCAKFPRDKCCFANLCTGVKVITLLHTSLSRGQRWVSREQGKHGSCRTQASRSNPALPTPRQRNKVLNGAFYCFLSLSIAP